MPYISIIVPVYNIELYLVECIESLINQTYKNIEIVLVDDGSTDMSGEICDAYAEKDSRIKVYHIKNSGSSIARNYGLEKSIGEYVMFVDSDDWIANNTLEICYELQQKHQGDVVLFNLCDFEGKNEKKQILFQHTVRIFEREQIEYLKNVLLSCQAENIESSTVALGGSACKMYKRSLLQGCEFPSELAFGEDACFMAQVLEKVKKVVYTDHILYHRRVLTTSLQHSKGIQQIENRKKFVNWLIAFYKDKRSDIINQFIYHHYFMCILALKDSKELSIKDKERQVKKYLKDIDYRYDFRKIKMDYEKPKKKLIHKLAKRKQIYLIYILLKCASLKR